MVFRLRGLLGFFGISSKLSPVDGGSQRYVAVCVRERELGQMIALSRMPVAVGCCFYGDGCVHDSASLLVRGLQGFQSVRYLIVLPDHCIAAVLRLGKSVLCVLLPREGVRPTNTMAPSGQLSRDQAAGADCRPIDRLPGEGP